MAFWEASAVKAMGLFGSGKVRMHAFFSNVFASSKDSCSEGSLSHNFLKDAFDFNFVVAAV